MEGQIVKRGRGRPVGSKNKNTQAKATEQIVQQEAVPDPLLEQLSEPQKQIIEGEKLLSKVESNNFFKLTEEDKKDLNAGFKKFLDKSINDLFSLYKQIPEDKDIQEEIIWSKISTYKRIQKTYEVFFPTKES